MDPANPPTPDKEPETFSEQRERDFQMANACLLDLEAADDEDDYGEEEMYRESDQE